MRVYAVLCVVASVMSSMSFFGQPLRGVRPLSRTNNIEGQELSRQDVARLRAKLESLPDPGEPFNPYLRSGWQTAARVAGGPVRFVDQSVSIFNSDGLTWATAYKDLQMALAEATLDITIVEIRIAQGTYKPDAGTGDRAATFLVRDGLTIRGGFPSGGGEQGKEFETILSGDLNGNDLPPFLNREDNAESILTATGCVLEHITIAHAYGAQSALHVKAVVLQAVSVTGNLSLGYPVSQLQDSQVYNSMFRDNMSLQAWYGGAAQAYGYGFVCHDTVFRNNRAHVSSGGFGNGGGLSVNQGFGIDIRRCIFEGNTASGEGGGMYMQNSSYGPVVETVFRRNSAMQGGGFAGIAPQLDSCFFLDNYASNQGGGLAFRGLANDVYMANCIIVGNSSDGSGGGVYMQDGVENFNNLVVGNSATLIGGIDGSGGDFNGSNIIFNNTDLLGGWDRVDSQVGSTTYKTSYFDKDLVSGKAMVGGRLMTIDDLFVDPYGLDGVVGTGDEDWHHRLGSSAIDAISNDWLNVRIYTYRDFDGKPRIPWSSDSQGFTKRDRGPYESHDCDHDGIDDYVAIKLGLVTDCNNNFIPDSCDMKALETAESIEIDLGTYRVRPQRESYARGVAVLGEPDRNRVVLSELVGGAFLPLMKLVPPTTYPSEQFGYSLTMDEQTLCVLGVQNPGLADQAARMYFWNRHGNQFIFDQCLTIPTNSLFVTTATLRLEGGLLVITDLLEGNCMNVIERRDSWWQSPIGIQSGTPYCDPIGYQNIAILSPNIIVFGVSLGGRPVQVASRSAAGWAVTQILDPILRNGMFGGFLDAQGEWLAISDSGYYLSNLSHTTGAVHVYKQIAGVWEFAQTIAPNEYSWTTDFGSGVLFLGDKLYINSPNDHGIQSNLGVGSSLREYRLVSGQWHEASRQYYRTNKLLEYFEHQLHDGSDGFYISDLNKRYLIKHPLTDRDNNNIPDQCNPLCIADLDNSSTIDGKDLGMLLGAWGTYGSKYDTTGDGFINGSDIGVLLSGWGTYCP